jgi:hypothetical protein
MSKWRKTQQCQMLCSSPAVLVQMGALSSWAVLLCLYWSNVLKPDALRRAYGQILISGHYYSIKHSIGPCHKQSVKLPASVSRASLKRNQRSASVKSDARQFIG